MALERPSVCVTLLLGVMVVSLLQLGGVFVRAQRCSIVDGVESYITIEEQCLEGEIFFRATNMSSIPDGYALEHVDFDIYCNTSEGVPVSESPFDGGFDPNEEKSIEISNDSAVCRVVICYRIEEVEGVEKELLELTEQPVCDYTVQCPSLDNPLNGEVTLSDDTNVFSVATYSCDPDFIIQNVTTSRTCQIDGSWSGFAPACVPENLTLEVTLTADRLFPVVRTVVNLTCSGNGTPPLMIKFYDGSMEIINQDIIDTQPEGGRAVIQRVLPFEVLGTGPMRFQCVLSNTTSEKTSSIVELTGVVRRYIQICFELPQDVLCDNSSNFTEVLLDFASEVQTNCSCIVPNSFAVQTMPSTTCNESCQNQLFYSMSVLVDDVTELNTTLHEWFFHHDSVTAGGITLIPNSVCAPLLATTIPSPACSVPVLTTSQTSTSAVTSKTPTPKPPSSEEAASPSNTDPFDSEGTMDVVYVVVAVLVLLATFILLTLTVVIMFFFFHKRRKHVSDFATEGCDLPMFDPMQQLDQHAFEQQTQGHHFIDDKAMQKSMEAAQTANNSTSNGRIP